MKGVLNDLGRMLLLGLVRLLYGRAQGGPIDGAALRKVLLIRTDTRVGNVLLTTPLLRALRKGLPGARVDFLVAAGKASLVEGLADRIVVFDKRSFFRAPWRFWAFVRDLRRERYDLVIEAGHWHAFSFTSAWLARATRAPVRLGHDRGLAAHFLTHAVAKDPEVVREVPSKLELLRPLGISACGEEPETTVDRSPDVAAAAERLLAEAAEGRPVVAFNPGARKADHRWPAEAYGTLARRIRDELGAQPVILWGPGEEEIAARVRDSSGGAARLAPPTNLALLAAVFRRAALVVTNDTGPMHLAVAAGAPVLAVLLAEDGARWSHAGRFEGVAARTGEPGEVDRILAAARRLIRASAGETPTRAVP